MPTGEDWTNATPSQMFGRVLRPDELLTRTTYGQAAPDQRLHRWVERYWSVRWELADDEVFHASTLDEPAVNITVERGGVHRAGTCGSDAHPAVGCGAGVWVTGPVSAGRFDVSLTATGGVVGVKFRVGGIAAFRDHDLGGIRGRTVPASAWFGDRAPDPQLPLDAEEAAPYLDSWLLGWEPEDPPGFDRFLRVLDLLASPEVTTLSVLAERTGQSVRTLQRLIGRFTGMGAKRMLVRARVMDAVAAIDRGDPRDIVDLAMDLGWFDQPHFIRDFRTITGETPGRYAQRTRSRER